MKEAKITLWSAYLQVKSVILPMIDLRKARRSKGSEIERFK